jgi:uncharacterized membrane protein YedE/YeeE
MTMPAKVTAFLDVTGKWDPSLALVMIGAIGVYLPGQRLIRARRALPVMGARFEAAKTGPVDARLVGGAAVFGVRWGLVGMCPGPAIVTLGAGSTAGGLFVGGMLAAFGAYEVVRSTAARRSMISP